MKQVTIFLAMILIAPLWSQEHTWEKDPAEEGTYHYETAGTLTSREHNDTRVYVNVMVSEGNLWLEISEDRGVPSQFNSEAALLTVRRENGVVEHYSLHITDNQYLTAGFQDNFYSLMTQGMEEDLDITCRIDDAYTNYTFTIKTR